jgi:acyl-CoA synthetase (AMP-forming)/AMP-acid ligase II
MPFFHVGGSAAHMLSVFAMGATSVILNKFDEESALRAIQDYKITYVCFVPAMVIRLMDYPGLNKFDVSSLKTIAYTGAPMTLEVMKKAVKLFGPKLVQSLGQTETFKMTVLSKADHKLEGSTRELKRLESASKPPKPGEIKIADKKGKNLSLGKPGEIVARSDRIMTE